MGEITENFHCSNCNAALSNISVLSDGSNACCPDCGSKSRTLKVTVSEQVRFYDCVHGKVKDLRRTGKRKVRQEFISGADFYAHAGKMVKKWRLIDRDNDLYIERITSLDTNEIIHYTEEKLSVHVGHGSAKNKK